MKGLKLLFFVMFISLIIAGAWSRVPVISDSVHAALDPSFGNLLDWNLLWGMIIIVMFINLILTILHKYTTNQEELKSLKEEQKKVQAEMKELKDQPEKMMELQKKQMANIPKSFELTTKPLMYTAIPFILFIRWFGDYFEVIGNPKILFGFFGWLGTYLILSIVFSLVLRKIMKVH